MSILLSIGWFIFGFIVGGITTVAILLITATTKEDKRNGE